ncbi:DUF6259 domain-containing protein [Olivibacter ginsenosidimutans]
MLVNLIIKQMRYTGLILLVLLCDLQLNAAEKQLITLVNEQMNIVFGASDGLLRSIHFLREQDGKIIQPSREEGSPWEITLGDGATQRVLQAAEARSFTYKRDANALELTWSNFEQLPTAFAVTVCVSLLPDSAMSAWRIRVNGTQGTALRKVSFPRVAGIRDLQQEALAVPDWMGSLLADPRKELLAHEPERRRFTWAYPGFLSMQFVSLYNPQRFGLYLACTDSASYAKTFFMAIDRQQQLLYGVDLFPDYNKETTDFTPDYDLLIGSFKGNWFQAAQLYKQWAVRQVWSKNSRLKQGKVPQWLQHTGYWIWNRGRAQNVLEPAIQLQETLETPVSVLWHWWHGGSYDDSFPEFFPPRDGKANFEKALHTAQQKGIRSLVYMNTLAWGTSTTSWKYKHAARYAAKDINGNIYSHVYNIFTNKALANMCDGTDFWQRYYASLADTAINQYGVDGIYMDQACINMPCYDPSHGHTLGGGNYWIKGFAAKQSQVRHVFPTNGEQVLTGEGTGENWLPYLDAFLALPVSRERYAGIHGWQTIPLFQAVYHEYGILFGNYSSLLSPPYDEMWPRERAPKDAETPLDTAFNKQFLMEQARSYIWGMQPTIANYQALLDRIRPDEMDYIRQLAKVRQSGLKFFLHGSMMETPTMMVPNERMPISKLSIYAGQNEQVTRFEKTFPQIYTAAWKSADRHLAVAIASIYDRNFQVNFRVDCASYGIAPSGTIIVHDGVGTRKLATYRNGEALVQFEIPKKDICYVEFVPDPS